MTVLVLDQASVGALWVGHQLRMSALLHYLSILQAIQANVMHMRWECLTDGFEEPCPCSEQNVVFVPVEKNNLQPVTRRAD